MLYLAFAFLLPILLFVFVIFLFFVLLNHNISFYFNKSVSVESSLALHLFYNSSKKCSQLWLMNSFATYSVYFQ